MDAVKIGNFLQALRKAKGYTQQELADYLNLSNKTISKWETGQSIPDIQTLQILAEFYEITVDEILNGARKTISTEKATKLRADYFGKRVDKKVKLFSFIALISLVLTILLDLILRVVKVNDKVIIPIVFVFLIASIIVYILPYIIYDIEEIKSGKLASKFLLYAVPTIVTSFFILFMNIWQTRLYFNYIFGVSLWFILYYIHYKYRKKDNLGVLDLTNRYIISFIALFALYSTLYYLFFPVIEVLDLSGFGSKFYYFFYDNFGASLFLVQ